MISAGVSIGEALLTDIVSPELPLPEAASQSIKDQIISKGYLFEEHSIITEDRFVLTAWRIPGKISSMNKASNDAKVPVYM